jgi:hypothetical protein
MAVVGGADDRRIDGVFQVVPQLAVIAVVLGLGVPGERSARFLSVHIAQRDDVLAGDFAQIRGASPTGADDRQVQFFVGVVTFGRAAVAQDHQARSSSRGFQPVAA